MWNRCSFQEGKENNCWLEQSPEKLTVSTVPLFLGHPVYSAAMHDIEIPTQKQHTHDEAPCLPIEE